MHSNIFAFGIGSSVNRYLIKGLARVEQGEPFVILNQEEAPEKAEKFKVRLNIQKTDKESRVALLLVDSPGHIMDEIEVTDTDDGYIRIEFDLTDYSAIRPGIYRLTLLID